MAHGAAHSRNGQPFRGWIWEDIYSLTEIHSVNEYKDATGRVRYLAALRHAAGAGSLTKSASNFVNEYNYEKTRNRDAAESGFYDLDDGAAFDLSLEFPGLAPEGAEIRYTTDGTVPGAGSMLYEAPIHLAADDFEEKILSAGGASGMGKGQGMAGYPDAVPDAPDGGASPDLGLDGTDGPEYAADNLAADSLLLPYMASGWSYGRRDDGGVFQWFDRR